MFTPKRIAHDCPFKSNQSQLKISILTPRCADCLRGEMPTAEIVVWCTLWRLTPWWDAHHRDNLRGGIHTAKIVSAEWCILRFETMSSWLLRNLEQMTPRCDAHCGDWLSGVMHSCTPRKLSPHWDAHRGECLLFVRGPDRFEAWTNRGKNLVT